MHTDPRAPVTTLEQLGELYDAPTPNAARKQIDHLDVHCREVIAASPFALLATADADGHCDVTPRGGVRGFARVLDEHHVALPDAKGNNRTDSLRNLIVNPHAGLLFLIPGLGETLRVNGPASLTRDAGLLADLAHDGREPTLAIVVQAREVFLHCAKAFIRSGLWKPETWPDSADLPSAARMLRDHTGQAERTVEDLQGDLDHSYATRLY